MSIQNTSVPCIGGPFDGKRVWVTAPMMRVPHGEIYVVSELHFDEPQYITMKDNDAIRTFPYRVYRIDARQQGEFVVLGFNSDMKTMLFRLLGGYKP